MRAIVLCEWEIIAEGMLKGKRRSAIIPLLKSGRVRSHDGPNGMLICEVESEPEQLEPLKNDERFAFHGTNRFSEWCKGKGCNVGEVEKCIHDIDGHHDNREKRRAAREAMKTQPKKPSLVSKAWSLAKSMAAFAADSRLCTQEQYAERLKICDTCPNRRDTRCKLCGCNLALKARAAVFTCPDKPPRWPDLTEDQSPHPDAKSEQDGETKPGKP